MNVLSMKAKLFTIIHDISQATQIQDISYIPLLSQKISGSSSIRALIILSFFGIVQVIINGHLIY